MKAIDYIYKNLTRLNKSILTQLLAKESVELTDKMWQYLQETPWNTNPVFLKEMGIDIEKNQSEKEDFKRTLIFSGIINTIKDSGHVPYAQQMKQGYIIPSNLNYLIITIDDMEYNLPLFATSENSSSYGEAGQNGPDFTNYPCFINAGSSGFTFFTHTNGNYSVTIEYEVN